MFPHRTYLHLLLLLCGWLLTGMHMAAQEANSVAVGKENDCTAVLERMKTELAKEPGRLILSVEDALATSEVCACAIIKTAVNFAGSDTSLIGEVVIQAIRLIPGAAAEIIECALREAPEASSAIRSVLARELGQAAPGLLEPSTQQEKSQEGGIPHGKAPVLTGKEPAPIPESLEVLEETAEVESDWPTVGVSGIYLSPPARSSSPEKPIESVKITLKTVKKVVFRPILPVSRSNPEKPDGFFK
jgi:hypothetical protein